jgi:hypothetical protein
VRNESSRFGWGSKRVRVTGGLLVLALVGGMAGSATGASSAKLAAAQQMTLGEHLQILAKFGRNYVQRLRPEVVQRLSSGGQTLIKMAELGDKLNDMASAAESARVRGQARVQGPRASRPGFANDVFAAEDFFSRLTGMTQSEPTAGWCASNALIGFNDTGSFVSTAFLAQSPSGSLSFNGWSQSTNAGASYTDRGALIADPIPANLEFRDLLGDPVIGCTSPTTFYYASLAIDVGPQGSFGNSGISVSRSVNGGTTFGPAMMAAAKDANLHFLDKPWMAVEPGATASPADDVIHVTYTDFDFRGVAGAGGPCPDTVRTAIEYVRSTNGGRTWSAPLVVGEVCETAGFVQGSQVEVGIGNDVYVAWESFPADFVSNREIRLRRSGNLGAAFGPTRRVSTVTPIGDGFVLQGFFRAALDLQGLAVDQTSGVRRGTVYLTFHDGRNRQKPDPLGFCGATPTYCFGDVFLTRSTNSGANWSPPARINDDDVRLGIDQWFPALDVDRSGAVWVNYYDRRRDVRNFLIDTFVARSADGGRTWRNSRATKASFAPVTGWQDAIVNPFYMGDYNAVAADATGRFPGVINAWGDNGLGDANVVQRKYRG